MQKSRVFVQGTLPILKALIFGCLHQEVQGSYPWQYRALKVKWS